MTVRMTPTEPDGAEPDGVQSDGAEPDGAEPDGAAASMADTPTEAPEDSDSGASGDSRRVLRESRRQRRRTAWLCAAVVALCLALTIAVVSLARYRPLPGPGSVDWVAMSASPGHYNP